MVQRRRPRLSHFPQPGPGYGGWYVGSLGCLSRPPQPASLVSGRYVGDLAGRHLGCWISDVRAGWVGSSILGSGYVLLDLGSVGVDDDEDDGSRRAIKSWFYNVAAARAGLPADPGTSVVQDCGLFPLAKGEYPRKTNPTNNQHKDEQGEFIGARRVVKPIMDRINTKDTENT